MEHKQSFNVAIVGCGLIGNKRARALETFTNSKLVVVCDINLDKAKALADKYGCEFSDDWKFIVKRNDINLFIISTINSELAKISIEALKNHKHVLVEKPAALNIDELEKIITTYEALDKKFKVKVGFNHRFHPSFDKARHIIQNENIGNIMFIRARYGHGGRIGYDKEWRAYKDTAGGGELLDQGSHLIDLARYILGEFRDVAGYISNFFWDMEVEDNCFLLLRTKRGQIAQLHASWTQWKNIFSFEIFCKNGQINIEGLGGSYGKETLTFYRMKPEMGIPDKFVHTWDEPDDSWQKEFSDFLFAISENKEPNGNLYDAYASMKIITKIYGGNKNGIFC